ncbi:hypothetical protein [Mesorhizobium sp. SP-1A]|uniref:hypothetical protein n=1 Tax=Mesorhizobium sp. SP-1A TaxID=3077840 RepID=UPI0028F6D1E1|nr:hypothetical protein [Mesorhizobium sp. SP-1A]
MPELELDTKTAERMGLPSAVATVRLPDQDEQIEVALLPPETDLATTDWAVIVHYGCDPDRPDLGSSSVEEVPEGRETATQRYLEMVSELRESLEREEEIRNLSGYSPM